MIVEKSLYWASRPIVGGYARSMLHMDVHRHKELPHGAKIIAANHPSTTDPFFVAVMLRQQSFILIKDVLFKVPLLGEYLHRSGHIPVCEGKGCEAMQAALEHLRTGQTVMIFPEGALSPQEGGFLSARTGVARLALLSGAPVVPLGIHLLRERLHSFQSVVDGRVEYSRWYLRGPYVITSGRPLQFSGSVEDRTHVRLVADQVMGHIMELANESRNRYNQASGAINGVFESF